MRYSVAHLRFAFGEAWEEDLFVQALFDLGFDTLDGADAYIPTAVLATQREAIDALIAGSEGVTLLAIEDCPDENWNATWEAEHPIEELPMGVRIVPHCAFGAGHHETTGMMIRALMGKDLTGKTVLDNGCGTGVLAIYAVLRGADRVLAVDIDDKSVQNAEENAERNGVRIETLQGDTPPAGQYDLILANIHRNILLAQMPLYGQYLRAGGELWLSGFYQADCEALTEAAAAQGLHLLQHESDGDWQMLTFRK